MNPSSRSDYGNIRINYVGRPQHIYGKTKSFESKHSSTCILKSFRLKKDMTRHWSEIRSLRMCAAITIYIITRCFPDVSFQQLNSISRLAAYITRLPCRCIATHWILITQVLVCLSTVRWSKRITYIIQYIHSCCNPSGKQKKCGCEGYDTENTVYSLKLYSDRVIYNLIFFRDPYILEPLCSLFFKYKLMPI